MLGAGVVRVAVGDGVVAGTVADGAAVEGGTGGTSSGGSGAMLIGDGSRVADGVAAGRSGAADEGALRGADRVVAVVTGAGRRAWVVGAIIARAEGGAGSAGGGAASWSTTEPDGPDGAEWDRPRVSQPISAHNNAWPTTSATAMRTVRRTVRVTGTGSTCRTLWQAIDVVEG